MRAVRKPEGRIGGDQVEQQIEILRIDPLLVGGEGFPGVQDAALRGRSVVTGADLRSANCAIYLRVP